MPMIATMGPPLKVRSDSKNRLGPNGGFWRKAVSRQNAISTNRGLQPWFPRMLIGL
jgi:hypothetical protein